MNLNEYQAKATSTAHYPPEYVISYPILGLVGEAGELANNYKKVLRDNDGLIEEHHLEELTKELGDVLWYVSQLALDLGFSLEEVARTNLSKLSSRAERGKIQGSGDDR